LIRRGIRISRDEQRAGCTEPRIEAGAKAKQYQSTPSQISTPPSLTPRTHLPPTTSPPTPHMFTQNMTRPYLTLLPPSFLFIPLCPTAEVLPRSWEGGDLLWG